MKCQIERVNTNANLKGRMRRKTYVIFLCFNAVFAFGSDVLSAFGGIDSIEALKYSGQMNVLIKQGDYAGAIRVGEYLDENVITSRSEAMFPVSQANVAEYKLRLAMLNWNVGNKSVVDHYLSAAIRVLDDDTSDMIKIFQKRFHESRWPKTFVYDDFMSSSGILNYLTAAQYDREMKRTQNRIRTYNAILGMLDAESDRVNAIRHWNQVFAKQQAAQSYQKKTHKIFNPNVRPSWDDPNRGEWDACKRVYDIFGAR